MDEKERKALERKRRKAERERQRYQAARAKGLTRSEAKNLSRTLEKKPELIKDIESISPTLTKSIENLGELLKTFADGVGEGVQAPKKPTKRRKKKPEVKFKPKGGRKPLTEAQKRQNRAAGAYKRFLKKNPELSARQAANEWRKRGHSISNQRANDIYRDIFGREKEIDRVTRFPTYALDENPGGQFFIKSRYMYVMEYKAMISGTGQIETRTMTIASDRKLNKEERELGVLQAYDQGELDQNEYYLAIYIIEDSIRTLYLVDTSRKTRAFQAFEAHIRGEQPDISQASLIRLYKRDRLEKAIRKRKT